MKYLIYHPQVGSKKPTFVECKTYQEAEREYKSLQDRYPSREMCLVGINDWGERSRIHEGRWD